MIQIVWYKRDLRVDDHAPLAEAARHGPVLPLYVAEPSLWHAPDASARHWQFIQTSLTHLRARLAALGQPLIVRTGELPNVLNKLHNTLGPFTLWAHQETGNALTYARDLRVIDWCRTHSIAFHERRQHGVRRGVRHRHGWANAFEALMTATQATAPTALPPIPNLDPGPIPTATDLGLDPSAIGDKDQHGGSDAAHRLLHSFLHDRAAAYQRQMSKPLASRRSCSRLSPHFAFGTLSIRQAYQATQQRLQDLHALPPGQRGPWARALQAFTSRLYWNSHFIQKLETEPRLEHESLVPLADTLRPDVHPDRLAAFLTAETGYPLVDACLRCVQATGYLNFRMRALLVSFAAHDLWLPWQAFHDALARWWIDYEPGIHLSQLQMQSGTAGNRTLRLYNPTKQGQDHDADGTFTRMWLPELARVPDAFLFTPWLMPLAVQEQAGCRIGTDYPHPLVQHEAAARRARAAIAQLRRHPDYEPQRQAMLALHGDPNRRSEATPAQPPVPQPDQLSISLEEPSS